MQRLSVRHVTPTLYRTTTRLWQADLVARRGIRVGADKMIVGALGATFSSSVIIGVFHLIVVKVPLSVAAATIGGAGFSGIFAAFEGGDGSTAMIGSLIGILVGAMGAYYVKTSNEPWRK